METSWASEHGAEFAKGRVVYQDGNEPYCDLDDHNVSSSYFGLDGDVRHPSRKERIQDWIIGALILSCILGVGIAVTLQFPAHLRDTPIAIHSIQPNYDVTVCPGDKFDYTVDIEVLEPGILSMSVGIIDMSNGDTVRGTTGQIGPFPRDEPVVLTEIGFFLVPELPAGNYKRVMAIDLEHADSVPVMWNFPFTIGEHCSE